MEVGRIIRPCKEAEFCLLLAQRTHCRGCVCPSSRFVQTPTISEARTEFYISKNGSSCLNWWLLTRNSESKSVNLTLIRRDWANPEFGGKCWYLPRTLEHCTTVQTGSPTQTSSPPRELQIRYLTLTSCFTPLQSTGPQ
jgi:hypothetical protein